MDKTKKDRRFKRTQQQLLCALKELINTKSIVNISVRELAELADVNRATFYLHYRDPYDMLEQLGNEFIENLKTILVKDNEGFNPAKSFVNLYKYVKKITILRIFYSVLIATAVSADIWSNLLKSSVLTVG